MPPPNYEGLSKLYTPETWALHNKVVKRALETGDPYEEEFEFIRPNGIHGWLISRGGAVGDKSGKVIRLYGTAQDITELKKAEFKLKEALSEAQNFREALDHVDSYIYMKDTQSRYIYANKSTLELFGCSAEELVGCDDSRFFPPDTVKRLREVDLHVFMGEKTAEEIDVPDAKGGRVVYWEVKTPLYAEPDRQMIWGLLGISTDITDRKRAEEALRESEARARARADELAALMDAIPSITFIAHDPECRRMTSSAAAMRLLRLPSGANTSKSAPEGERPDTFRSMKDGRELRPEELPVQLAAATGQDVRNFELTLVFNDGTSCDILGDAVPLFDTHGKVRGAVGAFIDVTERKLAEEELKKYREHLEEMVKRRTHEVMLAKEEAERANMAKTNFLHTMSHELRTPLNAVLGFSEMLKQKTTGELNEKQERFIDNIITGGNNLQNIIGQILDIVKMYEGTLELRIGKIPVPETVDEAIGIIKECAEKKNLLIEKNLDPELEYIEADKQKFKQIVLNLLSNAVKFSKEKGGTVTITAKKEGDMAKFSVSDRGIGIKEENIEKIFQKFTQLDSGSSRKYGGTGIGLAITKQFVDLHGGRIWAQSRYGEGSTFTFLIPLVAKKTEGK